MTASTICAESIESGMSAIAIGNEDQGRRRVRTRVENMQTPKSTIINGFGAGYLENQRGMMSQSKARLSDALPT